MRSYPIGYRVLAEVLIGIATTGGFVHASRSSDSNATWILITACVLLLVVAVLAGYYEPSAKRVWIHAPIMMSLELIALPGAALTCKSFECAGAIAFLMIASLFACVLVGFSYIGFALRRKTGIPNRSTLSMSDIEIYR